MMKFHETPLYIFSVLQVVLKKMIIEILINQKQLKMKIIKFGHFH